MLDLGYCAGPGGEGRNLEEAAVGVAQRSHSEGDREGKGRCKGPVGALAELATAGKVAVAACFGCKIASLVPFD